jgi:D-3-phosphoglycerate dehydrogenase
MKIAVIGDLFVRSSIYAAALRAHWDPACGPLEIVSTEVNWPDVPLAFDDEVGEYVGSTEQVIALCRDADGLAMHVAPVHAAVFAACPNLHIVGCCRGGAVNVNVAAATARGIPVVNAPGRNAQAVIEFTLGFILAELRGIGRAHKALSAGHWQGELYRYDQAGRELRGLTVGLVGCGAVAQGLVPYLKPFGVRIVTFDPYVSAGRLAALDVERVQFDDLLRQADVVSIHARVTPETRGMIGAAQLALMKPGAYLINTARGPLVDYDALYAALSEKRIAGAALDCFPAEPPPPDWPLLRLPNVTLTPHIAGSSRQSAEAGADMVAEDIAAFFAGRPLCRCVNPV